MSPNCTLNGDVTLKEGKSSLQIGKFCFIDKHVHISPPVISHKKETKIHKPCKIGSYVIIGEETAINSSNIGTRVSIGPNCKLGNSSIIHDCVIITPNTIIQDNQIIPPFSLVLETNKIEPLPESFKKILEINSKKSYINNQFTPSEIP